MVRSTKLKKWLIVSAVSLFLTGGFWYALTSLVGARFFVSRVAEFDDMPANDDLLERWLRDQPGVAPKQMMIRRDARKLFVVFGIDRNLRGQPPPPDLDAACRSLGYSGQHGGFEDYTGPIPP
jgi:hypothetical protein